MTPLRYIIRTALSCVAIINYGNKIPQMRQWEKQETRNEKQDRTYKREGAPAGKGRQDAPTRQED